MELWTCKGKGGRYTLLTKVNDDGSAELCTGAGTSKDGEHLVIYQDIMTHRKFYRTLDDFFYRMRPVLGCPDCEARQCIMDNEE